MEEFDAMANKKNKDGCLGKLRSRKVKKPEEEELKQTCPVFRSPGILNLQKLLNDKS